MENKREVSSEIRKKIIQLIHKELEEVQGENIFNLDYSLVEMGPVGTFYTLIKENIDERVIERPYRIQFTLMFNDGEPSIKVYSFIDWTERKEPYKKVWSWRGKKQLFTEYREYTVTTEVTCGHIRFKLTDEERQDLIYRARASWNKYQSLKDIALDNKVLDKINLRLEDGKIK